MSEWKWRLVYLWCLVVGILVGYFVIPFHHDTPTIVP
jgi:hypothetical protein